MINIRAYCESDSDAVGRLIADTYGEFNLDFASPEEKQKLLGPFQHARSTDEAHRAAIAQALRASMVYVAEDDGEIVGVLRGRQERVQSLFVRADYHRHGVGRRLLQHFEAECLRQQSTVIRLAATLYAVPFYLAMGYRRSTGIRNGWSFGGTGLRYQPMKKILPTDAPILPCRAPSGSDPVVDRVHDQCDNALPLSPFADLEAVANAHP